MTTTSGGRPNCRWRDNVVVGINAIGFEGADCINLAQDWVYSDFGGESPVYTKGGKYNRRCDSPIIWDEQCSTERAGLFG
jgi:hypothetical protein